jgi:hypothetical protein
VVINNNDSNDDSTSGITTTNNTSNNHRDISSVNGDEISTSSQSLSCSNDEVVNKNSDDDSNVA